MLRSCKYPEYIDLGHYDAVIHVTPSDRPMTTECDTEIKRFLMYGAKPAYLVLAKFDNRAACSCATRDYHREPGLPPSKQRTNACLSDSAYMQQIIDEAKWQLANKADSNLRFPKVGSMPSTRDTMAKTDTTWMC